MNQSGYAMAGNSRYPASVLFQQTAQSTADRDARCGQKALDELVAQAQELGMGYGPSIGAWQNPFRDKTDAEIARLYTPTRTPLMEAAERGDLGGQNVPFDRVHQPAHYARYTIEPATFIAANGLPFDVGNVVKYVLRYDAKNGREDLLKARRYIDMILERLDREDRVEAGESAADVWKVAL